jgi:multidrug efflux pump subunit AcrA (membrane-fusion protein)
VKVFPPGVRGRPDASRDSRKNGRGRPIERWRRWPWIVRWGIPLLGLLLVLALVLRPAGPSTSDSTAAPTAAPAARLIAHGVVAPVNQARVGTLGGGVLIGVSVAVGQTVGAQQELARVRGPQDVEVLTAPFAGTVTGLLMHTGDTLVPGASVVMIADLSRLQVETTDVDEFLIAHVRAGQNVSLQIEALDRREVTGRVGTVALQPQSSPGGDQQYPVTIDLGGQVAELRPGMSVRITFPD